MFRKMLFYVCLSFAVSLGLAACSSSGAGSPASARPTAEEVVSGSFNADKPTIILQTFNGTVDVSVGSGTAVKIDVTKRGSGDTADAAQADLKNIQVTMNQDAGTVHVTAQRTDKRTDAGNSGASAKLTVPAGSILQISTSNGAVTTSGQVSAVTVQTSNGVINISGATGALDLKTSNGDIVVNGGSGTFALETSNGSIDATTTLDVQVTATSSNGSLRFNGPLAAKSKSVLRNANGVIAVTLPAAASFTLDAATTNGKITSDFAVKSDNPTDTALKGTVGSDSQTSLKLQTSNANIEVHKGR